jgi:hypothetical protein
MKRLKLTKMRQGRFLQALANTGSVTAAIAVAGSSRTRLYELRKADPAFACAWQEAEETAVDRLEDEARRRAMEGVPEPLVSAGKLVRDDEGQPIVVRRYSDHLLLAKRTGHRGMKGQCASNCRRCSRRPMQLAQWQRSPPGLPLARLRRAKQPSCRNWWRLTLRLSRRANLISGFGRLRKETVPRDLERRLQAVEIRGRRDRANRYHYPSMDRAEQWYASRSARRDDHPRCVQISLLPPPLCRHSSR